MMVLVFGLAGCGGVDNSRYNRLYRWYLGILNSGCYILSGGIFSRHMDMVSIMKYLSQGQEPETQINTQSNIN